MVSFGCDHWLQYNKRGLNIGGNGDIVEVELDGGFSSKCSVFVYVADILL